ncbi:MAG: TM0106 family RecB-like putative nuclease [Gemmatimonadota bacterium]|nr:TM0106 family RecB-like putative nuclease [Gemmatimonadota bacterium]
MRVSGKELSLSATDLSNFLSCRHLTGLEMAVAHGTLKRPMWHDPLRDLLFERGRAHERAYVESLRQEGRRIVDLREVRDRDAAGAGTLEAMRSGVDVIVQGALREGRWFGLPDVMQRVETPSDLGAWSYEISDTKLARETRAGTILQLGLYSEMLAVAQGERPEHFYVATPESGTTVHRYRVDDYSAYFRFIRGQMEKTVALDDDLVAGANYPEPVDHCEVCAWFGECDRRRRADDHLSLVAGISRLQRRELESRQVKTLAGLAGLPLPLPFKPNRGSAGSYERVREQARLQFASRDRTPPLRELRPLEPGLGLSRLPEPSPGDVFLDLEGDPYACEGGREYLFGVVTVDAAGVPRYQAFWAFTEREEREAFESVIDLIGEAWTAHPTMHIYHYAPYEPSAFKRLMGRYATREPELDRMLRAGRFIDLYAVVRQSMTAGIERYSIKNLEIFYGFTRAVELTDARIGLRDMEQALESSCGDGVPKEVRDVVELYNKDDCVSTLRLRDWLEGVRAEIGATGVEVLRPAPADGAPTEALDERATRVEALRARLLLGVPEDRAEETEEQHARWVLAYLLDWHRREDKAGWWEYFRLRELPEQDLLDEPQALAGLVHTERLGRAVSKKTARPTSSVIDRYQYPLQEMEIGPKSELKLQDGSGFGKVVAADRAARTVDIKKGPARADAHPTAVFAHTHISTTGQEDAIYEIAYAIAEAGSINDDASGSCAAAGQLLLARPPRFRSSDFAARPGESSGDFAVRIVGDLDRSVLAIQGPPGSGKTYTGARMVCELVRQGKKVGITATSHSVIRNLLDAVADNARKIGIGVTLGHKCDEEDDSTGTSPVRELDTNEKARAALASEEVAVLGGTSWLWVRADFVRSVDVLFVDEAGQMSLANVLAASRSATSVVLLGDPQQLDQPQKGSHPDGLDASALEHILNGHQTIPPDRGIFLPQTWRLSPSLCEFTSEMFYEGRLASKPGLERQRLVGAGALDGSGLRAVEVEHDGNCNSSVEEIEVIERLVESLTAPGVRWVDEGGHERQMTGDDILVVAPYNAQVSRLLAKLGARGVRVGTVDKFQGREAPVVIYSTATSTPEDAPRGMEFLYSPNRLNVATSRARCAAILVTNPRLFEPECRTPRQMKLANAFCRYRELATVVRVDTLRASQTPPAEPVALQ